ncbi:MAG TPA: hypothetical protein VFS47_17275, partial [Steroidobacteraceae bacterium]|nr:hypothetical protein [Steroidobacteraceae bacterium]
MFGFKRKSTAPPPAPDEPSATQPPKQGLLSRLRQKLNRGDSWLTYDLANLLPKGRIDDEVLD